MFSQALLLLLSFTPFSLQAPLTKRAFSNGPVITANFPDPSYINVGGVYYAFATNNGAQNIQIATSPDFNTWTVTGADALPTLPSWATTGNVWAPDVVQVADGSFVLYFSAVSATNTNMHCVGTATSSTVQGPYTANNTPFACPLDLGGAIDASGFTDSDGSRYVVYKVDGNSLGGGGICGNGDESHSTPLMLQAVEADGVTPTSSPPTQVLDRDASDGVLVEAPNLILVDGTYYLFFSSNCFNSADYNTKYATASNVRGPYQRASSPLLASGGDGGLLFSPGGATVGQDGTRMVFHADQKQGDAGVRQMWTAGVTVGGGVVSIS